MTEKYYQILGINDAASLEEIKKAFKKKALQLHPDRNKAIDSHEQFILLNEAYQYLLNLKTGKVYNSQKRAYTRNQYNSYDEYAAKGREDARKTAEYYSRKRYRDFQRSRYYKQSMEIRSMANQVFIAGVLLFYIFIPVGGYLIGERYGFYAGLAILLFASPGLIPQLKEAGSLKPVLLKKAIVYLLKHPYIQLFLLIVLNFVIFFTVIMNTLISLTTVMGLFIVSIFAGYFISATISSFSSGRKRILFASGISPSIISLFFLVNYSITFNPVYESYEYSSHKEYVHSRHGGTYQNTTMIELENKQYEEYAGIRTFLELKNLSSLRIINYCIKDGIFGFRVVKGYSFGKREQYGVEF